MKKLLLVLLLVSCGKDDANSASDTKGILESEDTLLREKLASLSDDSQLWKADYQLTVPEQPVAVYKKFFQNDGITENAKSYRFWDNYCWTDFFTLDSPEEMIINSEDAFNVSYKNALTNVTGDLTQMELKNGVLYVMRFNDYSGKKDYEYVQITQQQLDEMKDFEDTYPECSF